LRRNSRRKLIMTEKPRELSHAVTAISIHSRRSFVVEWPMAAVLSTLPLPNLDRVVFISTYSAILTQARAISRMIFWSSSDFGLELAHGGFKNLTQWTVFNRLIASSCRKTSSRRADLFWEKVWFGNSIQLLSIMSVALHNECWRPKKGSDIEVFYRWCFSDLHTARSFIERFGGKLRENGSSDDPPPPAAPESSNWT
jgi:hypothetical protein